MNFDIVVGLQSHLSGPRSHLALRRTLPGRGIRMGD